MRVYIYKKNDFSTKMVNERRQYWYIQDQKENNYQNVMWIGHLAGAWYKW